MDNWLTEQEDSYLATEKESVADLAVFQQLKQIFTVAEASVDAEEFPTLADWYGEMDASWNRGQIKGKEELEEIFDKLQAPSQEPATPATAEPTV